MLKYKFLLIFCCLFFVSFSSNSQWAGWLGVPEQQYKVYVESDDAFSFAQGYFITTFPCYSSSDRDFYKTIPGKNLLNLYCLEPPSFIYLTYTIKPIGTFVSKKSKAQGYLKCPVVLKDKLANTNSIPRMQINISECEKNEIDTSLNKDLKDDYIGE